MNSYIRIGAAALAALSLSACATVTRGTKQTFNIVSTPSDADVELSTGQKCKTPCKLKLKRKKEFTVTITKAGYMPANAQVQSKFAGKGAAAFAGNILIGGFIGGGVDASNGSLNSLKPNPLEITLIPVSVPAEPGTSAEAIPAAAATTAPTGSTVAATTSPAEPAASAAIAPAAAGAPTPH